MNSSMCPLAMKRSLWPSLSKSTKAAPIDVREHANPGVGLDRHVLEQAVAEVLVRIGSSA